MSESGQLIMLMDWSHPGFVILENPKILNHALTIVLPLANYGFFINRYYFHQCTALSIESVQYKVIQVRVISPG